MASGGRRCLIRKEEHLRPPSAEARSAAVHHLRRRSAAPHNPTGKVFTEDEPETVTGACNTMDLLAIADELYEHITYDKKKHISLASPSEMQKRTIITSSLSKTYSVTGMLSIAYLPDLIHKAAMDGRSSVLR